MKTILMYLLQVIACSGILYCYYHLFLRNKRFHQYNRFYLLAITAISVVIPFLNIPFYFNDSKEVPAVLYRTYSIISSTKAEHETMNAAMNTSTSINWQAVLLTFYFLVAALVFTRVLIALIRIVSLYRQNTIEKLDGICFIYTNEPGTPFSFFRWLFWHRQISLQSDNGQKMFRHELYHIRQKHSWDILFIELISIIFWVNPFFHLFRKEIKAVHEFLADEYATKGVGQWQYAELLLMQTLGTRNISLTNPFFHNQIKRRIAMITTSKKPGYRYFRKIMVLPVLAVLFILFAFRLKNNPSPIANESGKLITVVIDAGHGIRTTGSYDGAIGLDGINEDDLVLEIANKFRRVNNNSNIKLVFTRDSRNIISLKERTDLANSVNADLFISLHVAAEPVRNGKNSKSGIEVYISSKNKNTRKDDEAFANVLVSSLSKVYRTIPEIKKRKVGIWVLDKPDCPSVLIECGYITNEKDLAFLKEGRNQEKIAESILEAITTYSNEKKNHRDGNSYLNADTLKPKISIETNTRSLIPEKIIPDQKLLNKWSDEKTYGVWIDGKRIKNHDLHKFLAKDFAHYTVSKLTKTAANYGKHYYQVNLMTAGYYDFKVSNTRKRLADTVPVSEAMIVIDGKIHESLRLETLDKEINPGDIEMINVIKGKAAVEKYGEKGKNGVIEIVMKKSQTEKSGKNPSIGNDPIFEKVEIEHMFPSGAEGWQKYIEINFDHGVPEKWMV